MIKVNGTVVKPTIFPDKTSQIWKLPSQIVEAEEISVSWDFEEERELVDLMSLRYLLLEKKCHLQMFYLPYARQDKRISNNTCFNLTVFANWLRLLDFDTVTSVDVHSEEAAGLIENFYNIKPFAYQALAIEAIQPDLIVFPDRGAFKRYGTDKEFPWKGRILVMEKARDQMTGHITYPDIALAPYPIKDAKRILMLDDICDGGATFIEAVHALRRGHPTTFEAHVFVTHGIFSQGREWLKRFDIIPHCAKDYMK